MAPPETPGPTAGDASAADAADAAAGQRPGSALAEGGGNTAAAAALASGGARVRSRPLYAKLELMLDLLFRWVRRRVWGPGGSGVWHNDDREWRQAVKFTLHYRRGFG